MSVSELRKEYYQDSLDESDANADPIAQFQAWFSDALTRDLPEPNAMTLATASASGHPSSRIVLLKDFDASGFVFYTNYESRKGRELSENPFASLTFFYPTLERQIRVEGAVERVSAEESDAYFASRPIGSRLGAWASRQSCVVADRATFEERLRVLEVRAQTEMIPRPPHWGGFRVIPETIEFWQGRQNRLHDRLRYCRRNGGWVVERLEP